MNGSKLPLKLKRKSGPGSLEQPVMRLLSAWCLSADLLSAAVYPFDELTQTAKVRLPVFFLIFSLQILFLSLLEYYLKNRRPLPERAILPAAFGVYSFVTVGQKKDILYILLLCCLWTVLLRYYSARGWLRLKKPLTKKKSAVLIAVSACLFVAAAGGAGVLRYLTFRCPNFDFGIFCQMYASMRRTLLPVTTCERDGVLSHFAVHLSPILYALLPVYAVIPSPAVLQLAQAAILASAVVPLALLCRFYGLSHTRTTALAFLLMSFPAVACGTNFDFHENCFLLPLLLWLFYAWETRRPVLTAVFTLGVLLVKEDAAVYVAFFALFVFLDRKRYLAGGLLFAGAGAYFLFALCLLTARGEGVMTGRYGNFIAGDGSLLQAVKNVLINPGYALLQMTRDGDGDFAPKLLFFLETAAPLAFIPFAAKRPSRLLLLLPSALIHFLTLYRYQYDVGFQYGFGTSAFLFYLSVINLSEMKKETGRLLLSAAGAAGLMLFFALPFSRFTGYFSDCLANRAEYRAMRQALDEIPRENSVVCSSFLLPRLSSRETVYDADYHDPAKHKKTDLVILDARGGEEEILKTYLALGYRVAKTAEYGGTPLLVILTPG